MGRGGGGENQTAGGPHPAFSHGADRPGYGSRMPQLGNFREPQVNSSFCVEKTSITL